MVGRGKLVKQGNSTGLTLPVEILDRAGLKRGDEVAITVQGDGRIEITRADTAYQGAMQAFAKVARCYDRTLAKLAK